MSHEKKRVLFTGEASWLATGFAKFNREILKRLYATGKYEIAEFGNYGRVDSQESKQAPWKFYGAMPTSQEEDRIYGADPRNQFGRYKFDATVADFQPDVVLNLLDPWMMEHLVTSRFRGSYKLILCPTVDSAPQKQEWCDNIFGKADALTTYSRFGKRTLELQGLKVATVTSPGVDLDIFRPMDKLKVKEDWGLNKNLLVIGAVMRNQKRKLFTDLFEAYAMLRKRHSGIPEVERSVLLCHTSFPDVGWDIPELLKRSALMRHVIFTYKCDACKRPFFSWFLNCNMQTGMAQCIFCGQNAAHMPNTHNSISEEELGEIYNLMDIYCQIAICEGWGVPVVEAKACGVPTLCSNYSALEDHVENGGALAVDIDRYYTEAETMAVRSFSDRESICRLLKRLLTNRNERLEIGKAARSCAERLHNWDITAKKFEEIIDSLPESNRSDTWDSIPSFKMSPPYSIPHELPNDQFVLALYRNILMREPDQPGFEHWMGQLSRGMPKQEVENFFKGEIDAHNRFENIRFTRSLQIRNIGIQPPIRLQSNILRGAVV